MTAFRLHRRTTSHAEYPECQPDSTGFAQDIPSLLVTK